MKKIIVSFMIMFSFLTYSKTKIGVTMLPYYSYVTNIVGDKMEVVRLVPENVNAHTYDASAEDIKRLSKVDIVVVNGAGHDEFVYKMIRAAKNKKLKQINAGKNVSLLYGSGQRVSNVPNPHTFISVTQTIQQINSITEQLANIDKANANYYRQNAIKYIAKIRKIKMDAMRKIKGIDISNLKIATTHGGYDYLLSEFGLTVSAVVEPSDVQSPSIKDMMSAIKIIQKKGVKILFNEKTKSKDIANTIYRETGVYITTLDHMTEGPYRKEAFENTLKENMNSVADAIRKVNKK